MSEGSPSAGTPDKRATLRTVAEKSGFAITTVSRALANDPRIAKTTREKVAAVADELGYVPNRAAQRLRTGRTKVISLLLNTNHEFVSFSSELLRGMTEGLRGTGYAMNITPSGMGEDALEVIRNIHRNSLADAVVFTRTECFDDRVRYLLENNFPFATHGRTDFTTPHPYVDFDNARFARMAIDRLVENGRKHICMVMPDERYTFGQHLRVGARQAVTQHGIDFTIPEGVNFDSPPDAISAALRELHASDNPPDGYVCVGEIMALITLAALQDMGLTPGVEADILAKHASPISNHFRPRIETVREDVYATGKAMAQVLLRRMNGGSMDDMQVLLAPEREFAMSCRSKH